MSRALVDPCPLSEAYSFPSLCVLVFVSVSAVQLGDAPADGVSRMTLEEAKAALHAPAPKAVVYAEAAPDDDDEEDQQRQQVDRLHAVEDDDDNDEPPPLADEEEEEEEEEREYDMDALD